MQVRIFTTKDELPDLYSTMFFQSKAFFTMLQKNKSMTACIAVAYSEDGTIIAHLMAMVRHRWRWLPFRCFDYARIYGEGVYNTAHINTEEKKIKTFESLISALTNHLKHIGCSRIEVGEFSKKMFGYGILRSLDFVPVPWMQIRNPLNKANLKQQISHKTAKRIKKAQKAGITTRKANSQTDIDKLYKLLTNYYRLRKQRFIPNKQLFYEAQETGAAHIYITEYKHKIIGGSIVVDSEEDAMIWFDVSMKKRYMLFYPHYATIWSAIEEAEKRQKKNIYFMNIGLPFAKNNYRDFILSFGGKPKSSFRWFYFKYPLINKLLFAYFKH